MLQPLVFDAFVAPARLRPQLWRLLLGLGVMIVIYLGWMALMGAGFVALRGWRSFDGGIAGMSIGGTPAALVGLLFTFAGMALGTFAAVRLIHHRSIASLFGPWAVLWRDFMAGMGIFMAVSVPGVLYFLLFVDLSGGVVWTVWLAWLPVAVVGLLIQTGAEEVVFRGYLQQQLAARFLSRWVWMVLPSVLFGLVHYAPEEMGDAVWMVVFVTGFFGLLLADLTARSGSLGMAWGLHFANNLLAIFLFTTGEALDGLALYRLPFGPKDTEIMTFMLGMDMAGMVLVWGICRWWLRAR
ncbi:CPBP family intramembrane glutamic endopeptidase [Roseinatronobacter alkalisoli]|uniref:CPBP family intramembrane metalloprotease n=1 Tax=Roseinatronobacter alkalisoli TaxID=3028235 RepID=A0ABT5T401_9RHOB|nr:CPBP family intramembrane glutamic endopeptidase [Roseinatronobacter sp. HJB301]MDD7969852.1 CPBP family intramembrane metalloprotease [Roseinatronobacter sp. HJB301]